MKKVIMASLAVLLSCGISAYAADMSGSAQEPSEGLSTYSPQVCQFSLTSYSGTITGGYTGTFQVGLSCPQKEAVRATVVVFIDGEHVASKVVTVKAGNDYSDSVSINVGNSYNGQRYKLVVQ